MPEEGTLLQWICDFVPTPGASTADQIKTDAADDKHIKSGPAAVKKDWMHSVVISSTAGVTQN
jgi:hypothetical protein